tara:strand:+ start:2512 stop:3090 length:579 start_codon:yes stop_codon:yes gene_type:complete
MKSNRLSRVAGGLIFLTVLSLSAQAQQVKIYDQPPSAEQMGKHLFDYQPKNQANRKTRGLVFSSAKVKKVSAAHSAPAKKNSIGFLIEFAHNSADIQPASVPFLEELGKMLTMQGLSDKNIIIEGHADASGSEYYNLNLSERRASSIKSYLERNYGVSTSRLTIIGKGETQPLPGKNPHDRLNRRVQFYSAN